MGVSQWDGSAARSFNDGDGDGAILRNCRVLIVDDCRLRRESLSRLLVAAGADVTVGWDLTSLSTALESTAPQVILVNIASRNSALLLRCSIEGLSPSRVVVFGVSEDDGPDIASLAREGIAGFHLRSDSCQKLIALIRTVADGESSHSPLVSAIVSGGLADSPADCPSPGNDGAVLTAREEEVLHLLGMGMSNREIAKRLFITVHTVKNHVHSLLTKTGARSRSEAAAMSHGALPGLNGRGEQLYLLDADRPHTTGGRLT